MASLFLRMSVSSTCTVGPLSRRDLGNDFKNPRHEFGDPGAHAGEVGLGASYAPRDDSCQEVPAVRSPNLQRPAGVSLQGGNTSGGRLVKGRKRDMKINMVLRRDELESFACIC